MKIIASLLFVIATAALLFAWLAIPRYTVAQTGDYDADDDGLIEIRALEQLNAVRWDLDGDGEVDDQANRDAYAAAFPSALTGMGCPDSGCVGYELARNLDFEDAGSYASGAVSAKWTGGAGWLPIGLPMIGNIFLATFDGNYHTISNLYINRIGRADPGVIGLFGLTAGDIKRIGLIDVEVSGDQKVGGLAGDNNGGFINDSYVSGSVSGNIRVGGLVGFNYGQIRGSYTTGSVSGSNSDGSYVGGLVGTNSGQISASYATGDISGRVEVGGLVGFNYGQISVSYATGDVSGGIWVGGLVGSNLYNNSTISASYAVGDVSGNSDVGGLIGRNRNNADIFVSYATGSVSGDHRIGGLTGSNQENATIYAGYWDTQTSGQSSGVGEGVVRRGDGGR